MALRIADDDPSLNPGQQHADDQFNALKKAEAAGTSGPTGSDSPDSVNEAESNPDNGWQNNVSGNKPSAKSSGRLGFIKKKGPLMAIILTIAGGGIGIGSLLSPALLTQSILANIVQKFNIQETSFTMRTNLLLANKLVDDTTSGLCRGPITIMCKFTRPSNRFLSQLEKNGIKAVDSEGKTIEANLIFRNTRPTKYIFTNSAGESLEIEAKKLPSILTNNAEVRAAFHNASNSRFASLADSVFRFIENKFHFNLTDKLTGTVDDEGLGKKVSSELEAEGGAMKAAAEDGGILAEDELKTLLKKDAGESVAKLAHAGRGSLVNLVAAGACMTADLPIVVTKAARAFQMAQLIKYSMVFLSSFGAIKAGNATPAEVSAIGDQLTKVVNGKSAMDSFGMNYAITGATKPSSDAYKSFIPGSNVSSFLGKYNKAMNSDIKTNGCTLMEDPLTGEAINITLAAGAPETLGTTILLAGANLILGWGLSKVIEVALPPTINAIISVIPVKELANKFMGAFMGDVTQSIQGEKVGDALVSGASHVMGQTANAGGNMPLTPKEAVAYDGLTAQVQLAYAEEDRATKSPFDISSPNTMLGSIVQKLLPYYLNTSSSVGSIAHDFSFIGNIIFGSFSAAFQPATAGADSVDISQYQLCDDPSLDGIAAGPYCNIIYGIPKEYITKDPATVLQELIDSGNIDSKSETGDPVEGSDLAEWIGLCTNGTTFAAKSCEVTKKTENYALYTIDHRVQRSLDGPDVTTVTEDTTNATN